MMKNIDFINLREFEDNRGKLVVIEALKDISFEIKRIYFLKNLKHQLPRGFHAHRKLKQLFICISGSCQLVLDNGVYKKLIHMHSNSPGVLVGELIWREMHDFSDDCILMVLANHYYDELDYISEYSEFLRELNDEKE